MNFLRQLREYALLGIIVILGTIYVSLHVFAALWAIAKLAVKK